MQPKEFCQEFDVSTEIYARLEVYYALLLKWQRAINLVSNSTLDDAWVRHFADSAQLAQYVSPTVKVVADLGSGAGFAGLVLAIMRPDLELHMVESDERKAQFLRTVSRETNVDCFVHNVRIESIESDFSPDLVTARALSSLDNLCAYSMPWAEENSGLELLFLKGEKAQQEIMDAQNKFKFDIEIYQSQTLKSSSILHLRNLTACE